MEYHEIEELLNRYLEGETTLEEEAFLKDYFSRSGLIKEHYEMQRLFCYFVDNKNETTPPIGLTDQLDALINSESKKESRSRVKSIIAWAGSAAAVLVISFGIYQYISKPESLVQDTYKDPKIAYIETKRALLLVSNVMNRNTANLKYLAKVDESFKQMRKIGKINKIVNSAKNNQ